ncbi:1,4-dihydroxy-2-naphthoate polyprenyltransferase [Lacisediminihabitans profunda]|uniref:1,4-dihydroxy-2-naphthoate polyprenyltransferase n=1 Tax=Lacisediminihabitans profunda TaxID=2594790 RepID=UPI003CCC4F39
MANASRPVQKRIDPAKVPRAGRGGTSGKSGKPGGQPPRVVVRKASASDWIGGARLRTLPLAVSPVALGTASAFLLSTPGWHWVRALLALVVAVALQVGVNYANDYSDGIRGTDRYRVGPSRLTGSGAAKPRTVLAVALAFFALGGVAGVVLVVLSGFYWLLAVGAACIVAAYFYTGGKHPYGYYGLGEVFVFVFFGIVATAGTTYTQVGTVNTESWLAGAAAGLLACAVLMVNNLRDLEQDRLAKKRTLAVLVGNRASRVLFTVFVAIPFVILVFFAVFYEKAPYVFFTLLVAIPAVIITLTGKTAPEFILALKLTSLTALLFGLGLAAAIAF